MTVTCELITSALPFNPTGVGVRCIKSFIISTLPINAVFCWFHQVTVSYLGGILF